MALGRVTYREKSHKIFDIESGRSRLSTKWNIHGSSSWGDRGKDVLCGFGRTAVGGAFDRLVEQRIGFEEDSIVDDGGDQKVNGILTRGEEKEKLVLYLLRDKSQRSGFE